MKEVLLHPGYFGPIAQFIAMGKAEKVWFENEDNFQKQTYRNRTYIYSANGKLALTIPVKHTGNKTQHQKYREVKIENDFSRQTQHWKSIQTCYRTSPFFEFYEDDFAHLYHKRFDYLLDFNYQSLEVILDSLEWDLDITKTTEYKKIAPEGVLDSRGLVKAKSDQSFDFAPYTQVFEDRSGFLSNLSILDLLFNEGPNADIYLKQQKLPHSNF